MSADGGKLQPRTGELDRWVEVRPGLKGRTMPDKPGSRWVNCRFSTEAAMSDRWGWWTVEEGGKEAWFGFSSHGFMILFF
ncbi:hypothetical protein CDL12_08294 [Handroanthus impetiginosus]|uniref:Uncharacterized protein n=1 Tax=Handroanthus impetiginosus TaxID=429701 RepID=A0A2G9HNA9_9LAMI|nr:hypothetical protein CDL12_08294 [Handroanthus impetiginosus]